MVSSEREVYFCVPGVDSEGSRRLGGELFPGWYAVEEMGDAVGDDLGMLEDAVHGFLRISSEENGARAMERATGHPVYVQPVLGQHHRRA